MIPQSKLLIKFDLFVFLILSFSLIYFIFAWTPSSYALALNMFGVADNGLVFGEPRPARSDEWAVFTPYVQAVVNNGFERYNETSVYHEDFRNFNSLPLWDWTLLFKPQYWLFYLTNPAHAFSFSHIFLIGLFLLGYYYLFQYFGFSSSWSAWGSLLMFFTGYVQTWLTTTGPLLAYFPWVIIVFISNFRPVIKLVLLAYISTAFLLSHLYLPVIASLFFAGIVSAIAFCPKKISRSNIAISLVAGSIALFLVWLYYIDVIPIMMNTVYPGSRELSGGTLSLPMWIANFFPFFVSSNYTELAGSSIANIATSGSYLIFLLVVFVNYRSLKSKLECNCFKNSDLIRQIAVLLVALTLLSVWMVFPIPASFGKIFYWHKAIAQRHVFIFGLLLLLFCFVILKAVPLKLSINRLMLAIGGVFVVWILSKRIVFNSSLLAGYYDILIILPLLFGVFLQKLLAFKDVKITSATLLIFIAAIGNTMCFAHFNPIQSAKPIFERQATKMTEGFTRLAASHPKNWLVTEGFPGALLNGYGFPSITHVLIAPKIDFFKPYFPHFDEKSLNYIFNRYAHIQVDSLLQPKLDRVNVIKVPFKTFFPNLQIPKIQAGLISKSVHREFGSIDRIHISDNKINLIGWGAFDAEDSDSTLHLITEMPVRNASLTIKPRPDVALIHGDDFLLSGFKLSIDSNIAANSNPAEVDICLVFMGNDGIGFQVSNKFNPSSCYKLNGVERKNPRSK